MILVEQNPYKSITVRDQEGNLVTISEGDPIQFCLESGEVRTGKLVKLIGKGDKLKLQILPTLKECEEIWSVLQMADGSLKLHEENEDNDNDYEE